MHNTLDHLEHTPLWTALVTPFTASGEIDFPSLEGLLRRQERARLGVVLLGSTGENLALDLAEKKEIVNFACSLKLSLPLMVGVGGFHLPQQKEWLDFIHDHPAIQALLLVTPLYAKPGRQGQTAWFQALLDHARRPCMLYNVPSRCGVSLHLETVEDLREHPRFWAIKEASGSVEQCQAYVQRARRQKVFSGDDGLLPAFAKVGAQGLVSVASNLWPAATRKYVEISLAGGEVGQWPSFCETLFLAPNPIPAKAWLRQQGHIASDYCRPPLQRGDLNSLGPIEEAHQWINNWEKHHE